LLLFFALIFVLRIRWQIKGNRNLKFVKKAIPEIVETSLVSLSTENQSLLNAKYFGENIATPIAVSEEGYIGIALKEPINQAGREDIAYEKVNLVLHISDIIDVDLNVDEHISSGMAGAVIGGIIGGTAGAVVGSASRGRSTVKKIALELKVKDFNNPTISIPLYPRDSKALLGSVYNVKEVGKICYGISGNLLNLDRNLTKAQEEIAELLDTLQVLQTSFGAPQYASQPQLGDAGDLSKFKKLLDDGVITQEEFDAKKKQLLGL
jgi:hypothetical protein